MPSRKVVQDFVDLVEANRVVEAMESFLAEDASTRENNAAPTVGREVIIANERRLLERVSIVAKPGSVYLVDGDLVVINWIFEIAYPDGTGYAFEELEIQRWREDKIAEARFFYDPGQRKPPLDAKPR